MQAAVERLVGLEGREIRRAFPFFCYLFLTIAGSVASKAARDALFLDRFDATRLPYVDIAIAVIVGLIASFYIRLGARTNLRTLQVGGLLVFAASSLIFWLLAGPGGRESGALFIVIYLWVGVSSVLLPTQVWTLANAVMTSREAKRSFGFIGSGALLGWIVGGYATRESAARFGTETMLLWVAVALVLSAGLVWVIWRARPPHLRADVPASGDGVASADEGGLASLRLIWASPYLRAIAALIALASVVTTIVGWQFKATAKLAIPQTDELTAYFGTFNMVAGLASFALQLLLTGRVLKRAGIGVALFIVPTAIAAGSVGLLVFGTLAAAAALKASDQVLRYSIDKATVELLYTPVALAETFRVKSFIDTAVYRAGDAVGGLLVLVFAAALDLAPPQLAGVSLVLVGGWLAAARVARRQYVSQLRESIHQHRLGTERNATRVIERQTALLLGEQLRGSPEQVLFALDYLEAAHERRVHPAVPALLQHQSAEVRRRAIVVLLRSGNATAVDEVQPLLRDLDLGVRTEALLYLTQFAHVDPLARIEQLGEFPDFSIRSAMVAFLGRPGRSQNLDAARAMLDAMVASGERRDRLEAARVLALLPNTLGAPLERLLDDQAPDVVAEAIRTAGKLARVDQAGRLIAALERPALAIVATEALAQIGERAVAALRYALLDANTPVGVRRELPAVLQAIGTRAAQYALVDAILDPDSIVRHQVIIALNKLGQQFPRRSVDQQLIETVLGAEIMGHYRSYQVLRTLGLDGGGPDGRMDAELQRTIAAEAERIFRLLKILRPAEDMHSVHVGLQSSDPVVHDNALELIESTLSPELCERLVPLFDRNVSASERATLADALLGSPLDSPEDALAAMAASADPWLQSCAAFTIGERRLLAYADRLDAWAASSDPVLRAAALDARAKLRADTRHPDATVPG